MPSLRRSSLLLLSLALLLATSACGGPKHAPDTSQRTSYYVDANLGFALEHPQNWVHTLQTPPTGTAGRIDWAPAAPGAAGRLEVTALLPRQATGGFDRLLGIFMADQHDFTLASRNPMEIPGAAAQKATGHTPGRSFEVILITSPSRAFILAFSAPAKSFATYRKLFDEIVDSFRILP